MNQRVKKVISLFDNNQIDALLVTNGTNVRYLTQFPAEESYLLIFRKKVFYLTDSRYSLEAKNTLKGFSVICYKKSMEDQIAELLLAQKVKSVGLNENYVSVSQYKRLQSALQKRIKLVGVNGLIESLRAVKDAEEIALMREALKIHKQAHQYLKRVIKPGITEREILLKLEGFVRSRGVTFSFDSIIASGVNSCFPHAKVTDRKIGLNDIVLVDMGIDYKGYKSDLTRMFFLGRIPQPIREIHDYVREAQQSAIKQIQAGVSTRDIDKIARDYFIEKGIGDNFLHSLGHGVGMEVHELPRLSPLSQSFLQPGMVVTVEPGIYLSNKFGIRLEEMILITPKGCEILSDNIN